MPAPVGPTIATVWPGVDDEVEVVDERLVRLVAERDVLERDRAARLARATAASAGSAISSGSSSSSNTRSAEATADWRTFAIVRGLDDRERELARVLDERDDVAEASSGRSRPGAPPMTAIAT